ncbi:hypothetical protein QUB60_28995 [Microcoleus sp. A2-C5]
MSTDNLYKPAPTQRRIRDRISVAEWRETGFLRQFGLSTRNKARNPVSPD